MFCSVLLLCMCSTTSASIIWTNFGSSPSTTAASWLYLNRFCFRPNMDDFRSDNTGSNSSIAITIPFAYRKIPLFLAVYWDDSTSQRECEKKLDCYESPFVNDKWSNVYNGHPSDATSVPSCNWRLDVAQMRGNLIDLRPLYGEGLGHMFNTTTQGKAPCHDRIRKKLQVFVVFISTIYRY